MKHKDARITRAKLIRTYKAFQKYPNKVFLAKDFTRDNPRIFRESHLETLRILGLIEGVKTIYRTGRTYKCVRQVHGYRLRKQNGFSDWREE